MNPALAAIDVEQVPLPAEPQSQASALTTVEGKVIDPREINAELEGLSAAETIAWAIETFHPRLRFAASFQKTSSVTVDIVSKLVDDPNFFYLDTDVLFEETYITRDALSAKYGIEFQRFSGSASKSRPSSTAIACGPASRTRAAAFGRSSQCARPSRVSIAGYRVSVARTPGPGQEQRSSAGTSDSDSGS